MGEWGATDLLIQSVVVRGRLDHDPSKFNGSGGDDSGSGARTALSLALEGEVVQPRDEVDVLGVMLMRIMWLLDGKGLEALSMQATLRFSTSCLHAT
ncbi:hypothetical protein E2C01_060084 [Portunus trituberculatus]|uniref:Uncharacterized protein n=1 Tax=Portunus trituberculatus TaxID=210409 RepID=A0A5B7H7S1_PORTR|nr:hypothetical protein [Portunus trituberculatus]